MPQDKVRRWLRSLAATGFAALLALTGMRQFAEAAVTLHVAKAVAEAFPFAVLDIGQRQGTFAKDGVRVVITSFSGDAKLQEGLASGSVDLGLGSGPAMAFSVKGSPVLAVAAFGGAPRDIAVIVNAASPLKTLADLKGKLIAVSTVGSLTDWLAHQIAIRRGWGDNGIRTVATGAGPAMTSAILTGQVDAGMGATEAALTLEANHQGRPLAIASAIEPDFITHVIFARKDLIAQHPDEIRDFLKGFFTTIAYMRSHKAETVSIASQVLQENPAILDKVYDFEMPMLLTDGDFDPASLKIIKQSFVQMRILDKIPADDQILTRQFVPVKLQGTVAQVP